MIEAITSIKDAVEEITGVKFEQFAGPGKKRERYYARLIFVHLLELHTGCHYKAAARIVKRNENTVYKYDGFFLTEKKVNPQFRKLANDVEAYLKKLYQTNTVTN